MHHKLIKSQVPVISVGNISFGGTGKTPFVIYICNFLKKLGHKPAVIGRGYKRKCKNDIVLSDGKYIFADATTGGDEMLLIAKRCNVPVFVGKSKSELVSKMNNNNEIINYNYNFDCIIIDDGFQHKHLHRNLDIVLLDKKSITSFFKRESLKSIERANLIVCSNGLKKEELIKNCKYKIKNVITANKKYNQPYNLFSNNDANFSHKNTIALVGIAKPNRFIESIKHNVISVLKYSDHHYYTEKDILKIINKCKRKECYTIATTEKDAMKLILYKKFFMQWGVNVIVYPIDIELGENDEYLLKKMLLKI
ncbi:MAG: tetraacyldisaccharide 4'-kinase [Bacteroidetes bacterium]|nr:tetraacyldisaccharide 4'-kinase [Bacteroidota bacterium]